MQTEGLCGSMSQVVVGGPGGSMSQVVGLPNNSYKPITNTVWVRARLCKIQKKSALDSHPQVIKLTSCLPVVSGSLRVLRLLPPLKLVAMIQLKYSTQEIKSNQIKRGHVFLLYNQKYVINIVKLLLHDEYRK